MWHIILKLSPLGDQSIVVDCSDETCCFSLLKQIRKENPPWLIDMVQSYKTVAVFFSLNKINFIDVSKYVRSVQIDKSVLVGKIHQIPVCYEFELDMARVCVKTGLSVSEVIDIHTSMEFTVYAIGFCPGFPYMGYLPEKLIVPRLDNPRLKVEKGSVGIAGKQTGIYTEGRPGGWNIIGRTPLNLVNVEKEYFPLSPGDKVKFYSIRKSEYDTNC